MTDVPHPFAPFSPSPPTVPEQPKAEKPAKEKKPRGEKQIVQTSVPTEAAMGKPARKPRTTKPKVLKHHAPKFDLQTTLAAAQLLNEGDFSLFEKLVVMLDEAGKPARDRVLGALSKVFG